MKNNQDITLLYNLYNIIKNNNFKNDTEKIIIINITNILFQKIINDEEIKICDRKINELKKKLNN